MSTGAAMLVQKLRLKKGWSQDQLAVLSGLSVRTIQRLEGGKPASVETLKAVASVFEIDFNQLREPAMENSTAKSNDLRADEALALAHVRRIKLFWVNLMVYVSVAGSLIVANWLTFPQYMWSLWTASIWGVMVLLNAIQVFFKVPFLDPVWERRQVERLLGRPL
ncbi:2TM domain-containing protein [Phenylobacterium sp.]|uniref:2TM domain-containing protein n=1 Tax=Phenylobacterium sp. TaxID=1871053 RepID=UPI003D278AAD